MSGNDESGGGCCRRCRGCFKRIRDFPFRQCCWFLLARVFFHFIRSLIIILSTVVIIVAWYEFSDISPVTVTLYCVALIICSLVSFVKPKGRLCTEYRRAAGVQRQQERQCYRVQEVVQRPRRPAIRHTEEIGNAVDQIQVTDAAQMTDELGNVYEVPFDFHHAEEPSESSNAVEPESASSDEPVQQAAPSNLDPNLPQSSTDPSTQSTFSTPLEVSDEDAARTEAQE